ncbi:MAG: hypothetical protein ACREAA_12500 [Candidatus Polarisedimenticolia bacterium]
MLRGTTLVRLCSFVILLLAPAAYATAGPAVSWPQYRGPNRDGVSTETGLLREWPAQGPAIVWRRPMGSGFSGVAAVGDRI